MSAKIGRNDPCWCGSGKKYKKCHEAFDEKMELMKQKGYAVLDHSLIKTPEQIEKIKESCKINVAVLDYVAEHIRPGISTAEIDRWVHEETVRHGGIPAPLNYEGFPKSVCTSINEVVCHGIPNEEEILQVKLLEGEKAPDERMVEFQRILERLIMQEMQMKKEGEEECRSLDAAIRRRQLARKEAAAALERKRGRRRT